MCHVLTLLPWLILFLFSPFELFYPSYSAGATALYHLMSLPCLLPFPFSISLAFPLPLPPVASLCIYLSTYLRLSAVLRMDYNLFVRLWPFPSFAPVHV